MVIEGSKTRLLNDLLEVGDRIVSDTTLTTINTLLSVNASVAVLDTLHASNIASDSGRFNLKSSNVRIDTTVIKVGDILTADKPNERFDVTLSNVSVWSSNFNVADILHITNDDTIIENDVTINGDIKCEGDIDLGTLAVTNGIYCSNIYNTGTSFTIHGNNKTTDFNIFDTVLYTAHSNIITMSNDLVVKGRFECGNLTIQAFEERTKTLNKAKSNLVDFFDVEQGLRCPGAYFTPYENVFDSPTYFLHDIYLSSNLKIDPVFNVTVLCNRGLQLKGKLFGHEDTSNTIWIDDHADFANTAIHHGEVTFDNTAIYNNDVNRPVYMKENSVDGYWKIFTFPIENLTCDLIFQSRNNIATAFTDEFDPSIINFTGQHRCTGVFPSGQNIEALVGRIVVSTGEYSDLYNKKRVTINEAIPIVRLCNARNDKRVFGVISDEETNDMIREHKIGFIRFSAKKKKRNKKYMINSVGEGGIWVCNINGGFENGDMITSSGMMGYGMRQDSDLCHNYTVAKITCDCNFDLDSTVYKCEEFEYRKIKYKKAFVGCVYKC